MCSLTRRTDTRRSTLLIPVVVLLLGCGQPRPSEIALVNHSAVDLREVTISGAGFTQQIELIKAGDTARVDVFPVGESGLEIAFTTAGGKSVRLPPQGYFEGGYKVRAVIGPNLEADVDSAI
jgi:hypothetical protein